jgi:hypothetical protein
MIFAAFSSSETPVVLCWVDAGTRKERLGGAHWESRDEEKIFSP